MKCPNCGANIPDDKLYCEACGAELQIVPELEYDEAYVEKQMKETMSDIVDNEFSKEFDMDFDDDPNIFSMLAGGKHSGKAFYISLAVVLVIFIIGAVFIGVKVSKNNSFEHQIEMADEMVNENNLLSAISYLEAAYKIKPEAELLFTIADYYYTMGRDNDAIYTLLEVATGEFRASDIENAYKKVIALYSASNSYEEIAEVLKTCTNTNILNAYEEFRVFTPEFSLAEGTYEEKMTVKISTEGSGKIYYSFNSDVPSSSSEMYISPIFLEMGSYTVNAVYVNKYGVSSEVVTKKYLIDVDFVFEPTILTDSGEYDTATLIEAEIPVLYTLYYTTDGTDPDKTSTRYVSPIPMPAGESTFKFVCFAPDGTQSTIIERTYNLTIEANYSPSEAVSHLGDVLREKGILLPGTETKEGVEGRFLYIYSAIYPIADMGTYYFVVEYHQDNAGNIFNTNNTYAVSVSDLSVYKVTTSEDGEYVLIDF